MLEMPTVVAGKHMLENYNTSVVWFCDIHHICWNFVSVLVTVLVMQVSCKPIVCCAVYTIIFSFFRGNSLGAYVKCFSEIKEETETIFIVIHCIVTAFCEVCQ
jgi:hypothetical protein